ncbi:uncharacterized protein V2V93DRAFT_381929 [Kockiozyma suomiensis]|uniref:uncharacterized protein n=1 Tax=Kockiozyma suomiensis TaxID=1337062 RepID=UPI003343ADF0
MRSTPLDRAISANAGTLILSFTGIVVAACSYMAFFGDDLPKYSRGIDPVAKPVSKREKKKAVAKKEKGNYEQEQEECDNDDDEEEEGSVKKHRDSR